jgi:hypothetical protein
VLAGCGSHGRATTSGPRHAAASPASTYHFRPTTRCLRRHGWVVNEFNPSSRSPALSAQAFGSFLLMDFQDTPTQAADLAKVGRQSKGFVDQRGNLVVIWHAQPTARTKAKVYACLQ